jgi:hypothetical protein
MATKKKARAKRKSLPRKAARTMNQFATVAQKRVRSLQHEAEVVSSDVGQWVGRKAAFVSKTVKAQPVLMAALASAVGAVGFVLGRRA